MGNCSPSNPASKGECATGCLQCLAFATCYKCCDPELAAAVKTRDFTLAGKSYTAKVVDIYDGDTIRVKFRLDGQLHQMVSRMAGYDSPEMKPRKNAPHREEEKREAIAARDALRRLIGDRIVTIRCGDFDKYGRLLVTVFVRGDGGAMIDVNKWMVENKHGVPYGGGTKTEFEPHTESVGAPTVLAGPAPLDSSASTGTRSSAHAIVNPTAFVARTGEAHRVKLPASLVQAAAASKKTAVQDSHPAAQAPDDERATFGQDAASSGSDDSSGSGGFGVSDDCDGIIVSIDE